MNQDEQTKNLKMKIQDIIQTIDTHKGQNLNAIFGKSLKVKKGVVDNVEKITSLVIRGGIEYDNTKAVQEGRENGTLPSENAGLPWGEWVQYPVHIAHKETDYCRFYPASGADIFTGKEFVPKVEYYLNGEQVDKSVVEPLCLASEFRKSDDKPLCYTIKADNVKAILI
jgi:hypothetical protein